MSTQSSTKDKQSIQFYKDSNLRMTLTADKIYSCEFGYVCESTDENELLSAIDSYDCAHKLGEISGFQHVGLDNQPMREITKKEEIIHYEYVGKELRKDKAMLLLKCFSKDGKKG